VALAVKATATAGKADGLQQAWLARADWIGSGLQARPRKDRRSFLFLIFRIHFLVQRKIQKNLDKSFKAQKIL
jgi:hypothetical protein